MEGKGDEHSAASLYGKLSPGFWNRDSEKLFLSRETLHSIIFETNFINSKVINEWIRVLLPSVEPGSLGAESQPGASAVVE